MHALGGTIHGWHPSRCSFRPWKALVGQQESVCLATNWYQYSQWLAFTWWVTTRCSRLFRTLFLLWLSAMSGWPWTWCTNQYLGWQQYFFGSVYIAFGVMNAWTWDPGRPKFAHSLEFYFLDMQQKIDDTRHTHTGTEAWQIQHVCEKDRLSQIRASPMNQPVWCSVIQGCWTFPCRFFLVKPKWMLRYSPKPTGCNQDIWANPRKSLKQSLKKLPYSVYYLHLPCPWIIWVQ